MPKQQTRRRETEETKKQKDTKQYYILDSRYKWMTQRRQDMKGEANTRPQRTRSIPAFIKAKLPLRLRDNNT